MIEALSVASLTLILVLGLLIASYLMFARAWVDYQGEQTLYCLAEARLHCQASLIANTSRFLPWGTLRLRRLARNQDQYSVEAVWHFHQVRWVMRKTLKIKDIVRNKDLRW